MLSPTELLNYTLKQFADIDSATYFWGFDIAFYLCPFYCIYLIYRFLVYLPISGIMYTTERNSSRKRKILSIIYKS